MIEQFSDDFLTFHKALKIFSFNSYYSVLLIIIIVVNYYYSNPHLFVYGGGVHSKPPSE